MNSKNSTDGKRIKQKENDTTLSRDGIYVGQHVPSNNLGQRAYKPSGSGFLFSASDLREIADILDVNAVVPSKKGPEKLSCAGEYCEAHPKRNCPKCLKLTYMADSKCVYCLHDIEDHSRKEKEGWVCPKCDERTMDGDKCFYCSYEKPMDHSDDAVKYSRAYADGHPRTWHCMCGAKFRSGPICSMCGGPWRINIKLEPHEIENLAGSTEFMDGFETCAKSFTGEAGHKIATKIFEQRMEAMKADSASRVKRVLMAHKETRGHVGDSFVEDNDTLNSRDSWHVLNVRLLATISRDVRRVVDFLEKKDEND